MFLTCTNNSANRYHDVRGLWVTIVNNHTYEEVIITENTFYSYDENAGDLILKYKFRNDSLLIINKGQVQNSLKFERLSKDEFFCENDSFSMKFTRLNISKDTASILKTAKGAHKAIDPHYETYINDLKERRLNWQNTKK